MEKDIIVTVITALITSVVGPIAVHYSKEIVERSKNKEKDPLSESLKLNHTITEKLDELLDKFEGDRIWMIQFHNGGHFYPTGKSMQKFSMVYELLKPSTPSCQSNFQNIPSSLFSKSINSLYNGEILHFDTSTDDYKDNIGFTTIISNSGVVSSYVIPVFSIKNEFVAIVGIDYVSSSKTLGKEEMSAFNIGVSTIGGVLNDYLKT